MHEKIIRKAIKLSYERFKPNQYQRRYHFAICFDGRKPILICKNNPIETNNKAYKIGKRFNLPKYKKFPFIHAESHLVSKLLDRCNSIDTNWSIVVLRINRQGRLLLSKPCENCQKILDCLKLHKVYWSIDKNTFGSNSRIINI